MCGKVASKRARTSSSCVVLEAPVVPHIILCIRDRDMSGSREMLVHKQNNDELPVWNHMHMGAKRGLTTNLKAQCTQCGRVCYSVEMDVHAAVHLYICLPRDRGKDKSQSA